MIPKFRAEVSRNFSLHGADLKRVATYSKIIALPLCHQRQDLSAFKNKGIGDFRERAECGNLAAVSGFCGNSAGFLDHPRLPTAPGGAA